jgi:hypothetical protein
LIEEGEESENAENNAEPEEHQEIPDNSGTQTVTTTRQLSTNEFLQSYREYRDKRKKA